MSQTLLAVLYGLGGAVGWGVSNFFAAKASKDMNPLAAVFMSQTLLFIVMVLVAYLLGSTFVVSTQLLTILATSYLLFTLGLLASYRAYVLGPVSLTSPIAGAFSLIVVINSVVFLGEVLSLFQWIGIGLLFVGLFLVLSGTEQNSHGSTRGIALAFMALLFLGFGLTGFVYAISEIGWMMTIILGYFFTAFWSGLIILVKQQTTGLSLSKFTLALALFQLIGTISVSYGIEKSVAAVIVPISSLSPLVTSLLGILLLKETIKRRHALSIAMIVISLVLLSL